MMHQFALAALGMIMAAACGGRSLGQDALGSGNALDANASQTSGGRNARTARIDYGARNLIVTDNVAAGRGFKGTVGYTARYDFRGETGSDDLYSFRADSALSAPNFLSTGLTNDRLRFGQQLGTIEVWKASRAFGPKNFGQQRFVRSELIEGRLQLDHMALSSSTSAVYRRAADSQIIGLFTDQEGASITAIASSLLGVRMTPSSRQAQSIGLTTFDMARTRQDLNRSLTVTGLGSAFDAGFKDLFKGRIEPAKRPKQRGWNWR